MVKVFVGPSHILPPLLKCGVTMIVATTGALPALVATNEGIFPEPLATRINTDVIIGPGIGSSSSCINYVKLTAVVLAPHVNLTNRLVDSPVGLTVIVNVLFIRHMSPPLVK